MEAPGLTLPVTLEGRCLAGVTPLSRYTWPLSFELPPTWQTAVTQGGRLGPSWQLCIISQNQIVNPVLVISATLSRAFFHIVSESVHSKLAWSAANEEWSSTAGAAMLLIWYGIFLGHCFSPVAFKTQHLKCVQLPHSAEKFRGREKWWREQS